MSLARAATTQHNPLLPEEARLLARSPINGKVYPVWDDPKHGYLTEDMGNQGRVFSDVPLQMSQKQVCSAVCVHGP